jgi:hypothetical protein
VHAVFQDLHPVRALDQAVELGADLALAGRRDFVVMHFDFDTHLFHSQAHGGSNVLQGVDGRHWEITALDRRTVAHIAAFEVFARRPRRFLRFDLHVRARHVHVPGHGIEYEELGLGSEVGRVANPARLQIRFAALRDRPRITVVSFAVRGFHHVARKEERRLVRKRIQLCRIRIGHEQHVGRLDAFPTGDRGSVEGVAVAELAVVKCFCRD